MDKKHRNKINDMMMELLYMEKKHEFLMELLTEEQLEQYQDFCEKEGI